jgi:hypothetical protein
VEYISSVYIPFIVYAARRSPPHVLSASHHLPIGIASPSCRHRTTFQSASHHLPVGIASPSNRHRITFLSASHHLPLSITLFSGCSTVSLLVYLIAVDFKFDMLSNSLLNIIAM